MVNYIIKLFFIITFSYSIFPNCLNAQWANVFSTEKYIRCFAVKDSEIFAGTSSGVYLSTNSGESWKLLSSGPWNDISSLVVNDSNIYAGIWSGVKYSSDSGLTWRNYYFPQTSSTVFSIAVLNSKVFAGTQGYGVFYSTDNGNNWAHIDNALLNSVLCFEVMGSDSSGYKLFAGAVGNISMSTDNGVSWGIDSDLDKTVYCFAQNGRNLYAGTLSGVYLSTNEGINWVNIGLQNKQIESLTINTKGLFAGTFYPNSEVFVYNSENKKWLSVYTSGCYGMRCLATVGEYFFVGTGDDGIWMQSLNHISTGISENNSELKNPFLLNQNYPNPFNPSTKIDFELPKTSFTTLKIFDILGRLITTLIAEELSAGFHSKTWNAIDCSSGVYYYTLESDKFRGTKKLILQK